MTDSCFFSFVMTDPSWSETAETPDHSFADIYDLANSFLSISAMPHQKLQKLCYYAKAWYLALYDENLVHEPFEAWVNGAAQPKLYQKYKAYGFQLIPMYAGEQNDLPEEFLSFAREIYSSYGDLSGDDLEKLNHSEMPWINARKGLMPWQGSHNVIDEEDMKEYYRGMVSGVSGYRR